MGNHELVPAAVQPLFACNDAAWSPRRSLRRVARIDRERPLGFVSVDRMLGGVV
jgi:hypothetical protein